MWRPGYRIPARLPCTSCMLSIFLLIRLINCQKILLSTRVGRTLGKTNGLETLVLRAAKYSSNLDGDIACDCIFAIYSGNSTIHQGILHPSGTRVAIKTIKCTGADSDMIKVRQFHYGLSPWLTHHPENPSWGSHLVKTSPWQCPSAAGYNHHPQSNGVHSDRMDVTGECT